MKPNSWLGWGCALCVFCGLVLGGCATTAPVNDDDAAPKQYSPKMATYAGGG